MKYSTLKSYIQDGLTSIPRFNRVAIEPGPSDPESPGRFIVPTRLGGPGLQVDGLIDAVGYSIKCVGEQNSYEDAEDLAMTVDAWLLNTRSKLVHGEWVVAIARVGSPPVPLLVDNADRTHFVCNYTMTVKSGIFV